MSNTGHKWIYQKVIPRLKNPIRYIVRVFYKGEEVYLGMFHTLNEAVKRRNQFITDYGIDEIDMKRYNRKENGN